MNTKMLLAATAILELPTGVILLIAPSLAAELLLGTELSSPAAVAVGRVAGAALFSIGLNCLLEWKGDGRKAGLVIGLLAYNLLVAILLAAAAVIESLHGIALWPACVVHTGLALWCLWNSRRGTA
ncbi:MAG TPA: hypothetical protein VE988_22580 [Gemmataceae bacterium]|nr:hypothetical protein [Gemmataceae bacterium]